MKHTAKSSPGFTLVELLIVIAIIAALLAILLPSMNRAVEVARRAQCASNQHQIHIGAIAYASANHGVLFIARGREVQNAFNPLGATNHRNRPSDSGVDWIAALASVGLAGPKKVDVGGGYMNHPPSEVWDCPSRDYTSQWETEWPAMIVGYQYMGGIETWKNPFVGTMPARSPLTIAGSRSNWVLAADATGKIDFAWGSGRLTGFAGMPPHRAASGPWPEGHNQVDMSGAVQLVKGEELLFVHSWGGFNRAYFLAQADLGDWTPPVGAFMDAFK